MEELQESAVQNVPYLSSQLDFSNNTRDGFDKSSDSSNNATSNPGKRSTDQKENLDAARSSSRVPNNTCEISCKTLDISDKTLGMAEKGFDIMSHASEDHTRTSPSRTSNRASDSVGKIENVTDDLLHQTVTTSEIQKQGSSKEACKKVPSTNNLDSQVRSEMQKKDSSKEGAKKPSSTNNLDSQVVFDHPLSIKNEAYRDSDDENIKSFFATSEIKQEVLNNLNCSTAAILSEGHRIQPNSSRHSLQEMSTGKEKSKSNCLESSQRTDFENHSSSSGDGRDPLNPLARKLKDKSFLDATKSKSTASLNADKPSNNRIGVYFNKNMSESTDNLIFTYCKADDKLNDDVELEDSDELMISNISDCSSVLPTVMTSADSSSFIKDEEQIIGDNVDSSLIIPDKSGVFPGLIKKKKVPTATLR